MSNIDKFGMGDSFDASVTRNAGSAEEVGLKGHYTFTCYDKNGDIKWTDGFDNLTTNEGRANLLDSYFANTGGGAVVMGLMTENAVPVSTPAYTDTQASHAGWFEAGNANAPTYSGTRKTPSFSSATNANPSVLSTAAAVVFSMTGSGTVTGAFINVGGSATIDDTTGTLFSAGNFTAGSKTVTSGDTINVTYTLSASG
jgi:hypothetical protein